MPSRSGLAAGALAYVLWGLFPLYWPLLDPASPVEILAQRIAWSFVFLVGLVALTGGFGWARALDRRRLRLLTLAAALITVNWGGFIYGVTTGHVVEASLGYFITPLVTMALAVLVLHERLSRPQAVAVAVATVGVAALAVEYGRPPWIALTLASSFGLYGLVKKRVNLPGTRSLFVETAVLTVPAVAYIALLQSAGDGTFADHGAGHAALLAGSGVATALPLILFGAAAIRIPLVTLGVLQYIAPVMQFAIGVFIDGERMPPARLAAFALVWVALAIFTVDGVRTARRVPASPPPPDEPEGAEALLAGSGRGAR